MYYFPRLCFTVCVSYSFGLRMPVLGVGICHSVPAETDKILFCKTTFLSSLWLNKQSSEVADFHHCTLPHHLWNSPDEEQREGKTGIQSWLACCRHGCHSVETFQLPLHFSFWTKGQVWLFLCSYVCFYPPALSPFEDQSAFWQAWQCCFKKAFCYFICMYLLFEKALSWKTVRGSSTMNITRATARLLRETRMCEPIHVRCDGRHQGAVQPRGTRQRRGHTCHGLYKLPTTLAATASVQQLAVQAATTRWVFSNWPQVSLPLSHGSRKGL